MKLLKKFQHLLLNNKTYHKRHDADLMHNSPWDATFDRSNTPKDMYGAISENHPKNSKQI